MYRDPFEEEHQQAIDLLNSLEVGKNPTSAISQLIDHVSLHFIEEDKFMREVGYPKPKRIAHIEEHNHVQEAILHILPKLLSGNIEKDELDLFRESMIFHINTFDAEMLEYAKKHHPEMMNGTEPIK